MTSPWAPISTGDRSREPGRSRRDQRAHHRAGNSDHHDRFGHGRRWNLRSAGQPRHLRRGHGECRRVRAVEFRHAQSDRRHLRGARAGGRGRRCESCQRRGRWHPARAGRAITAAAAPPPPAPAPSGRSGGGGTGRCPAGNARCVTGRRGATPGVLPASRIDLAAARGALTPSLAGRPRNRPSARADSASASPSASRQRAQQFRRDLHAVLCEAALPGPDDDAVRDHDAAEQAHAVHLLRVRQQQRTILVSHGVLVVSRAVV